MERIKEHPYFHICWSPKYNLHKSLEDFPDTSGNDIIGMDWGLLMLVVDYVINLLLFIIHDSLVKGKLLDDYKFARITPLYKRD